MKKIDVIVKDKNTIILKEDALSGDYIDLSDLSSVDISGLEALIEEKKDQLYEAKLAEFKKSLLLEHNNDIIKKEMSFNDKLNALENKYQKQIADLQNQLSSFDEKKDKELDDKEHEYKLEKISISTKHNEEINDLKNSYNDKITFLTNKLEGFEADKKSALEKKDMELEIKTTMISNKYEASIADIQLKNKLEVERLNNKLAEFENNQKTVIENEKLKLKEVYNTEKEALNDELKNKDLAFANMEASYKEKLIEKDNAYALLQRQKASLNVKQTGEDLESWCDNEMKSYRQVGLFNTTWIKDNDVVKEEGEAKGSKADYIFKIFATDEHNEADELASVCLDMKDENPDSVTKQTNEHYYKALDKNRIKKNCKYAVLVSNLETDKPNDLPVWKVDEYPDMYVVRPAYMMTFLSMLNSLTIRFKDLLLEGNRERLELMNSIELKEKFEQLKNTYLDKPLEGLDKCIGNIRDQSIKLKQISNKIDEECDKVARSYLTQIEAKLNKFEVEVDKAYRKYEKNNK